MLPKFFLEMDPEVKYELLGIVMFTVGILGGISLLGLNTGPVGLFFVKIQKYAFGVGAPIVPLLLAAIGSRYIWTRLEINYSVKFWGFILLYLLFLAIYHHFEITPGQEIMPESLIPGGGLVGGMILFFLRKLFGVDGTIIILAAIAICCVIATTTWSLNRTLVAAKRKAEEGIETAREAVAAGTTEISDFVARAKDKPFLAAAKGRFYDQDKESNLFKTEPAEPKLIQDTKEEEEDSYPVKAPDKPCISEKAPLVKAEKAIVQNTSYKLPPLSILKKVNKPKHPKVTKEISENAALLVETLQSFGVSAKIINTCQGPAVTRYELEPAAGVKVSKIVGLSDDIALKLAATGIRMEAPIPGKAAIGIEVPNKDVTGVHLREVLESEEFLKAKSHLTVALGKDIAGQPIVADLSKMPHMLVAGATGSGKSVCINTLLTSILFKATPDEVKFILVDPKVVELSNYNGIPHLMTPVVTDAKKAAAALNWAVQEMERRYAVFAAAGVRDIKRYNETIEGPGTLPLILIIIDELADLMMAAPVDVENAICRLAQKARAAGLHLVLATQRPSVDVITGTIKANIPSRISFAVSSQIDSRTILDMAGAEKLLGKGDMLFYPVGAAKPLRVQGAFISDSEVEELINYIKPELEPEYTEEITLYEPVQTDSGKEPEKFDDELLEDAIRMVMETGQASASMLQRKFRIGYSRAGRLIDTMEEMKIVGPNMGSKPREILMSSDQINALYFKE